MDSKVIIAKRVALELKDGMLVNLGIGLPTTVPNYLASGTEVYFQSENGIIGMAPAPDAAMTEPSLTDAGGGFVGAIPGAASIDSCLSFGLIRGGHLDLTVLGGLEVDESGQLANWMVPGKMIPGMGGAMDLVTGTKKVIVAMVHQAKGKSKILKKCTLPLTSIRRVDLVVTDMAVLEPTEQGLVLRELAPGVTKEQVIAASEATLIVPDEVPEMPISCTEETALATRV
jgi:acetate CoA/acetoacetate CoA-transferase beta subunit